MKTIFKPKASSFVKPELVLMIDAEPYFLKGGWLLRCPDLEYESIFYHVEEHLSNFWDERTLRSAILSVPGVGSRRWINEVTASIEEKFAPHKFKFFKDGTYFNLRLI